MTYSQYGLIQAADFNAFVADPAVSSSTANKLNNVWGIGSGNTGYGQTGVPQVTQYGTVSATDWANLVNTTTTIAGHQNSTSSITAVTAPTQGGLIQTNSAISTNLSTIYSNRLNAAAQGASVTTTTPYASAWSSAITFTHTITFDGSNQARYFFNAGGQLALTFSHPTGTGINSMFNTLASACGTIVISAPTATTTATIAGTAYRGVAKVGGSGTVTTLLETAGYYSLTTANQEIFKQFGTGTPAGYTGSYISVNIKSNGGSSNGDAGSVITITTLWDEVPNGLSMVANSTTALTVRPPSTSYLNKSWGTISVTGSVTGS